MNCPQCANVVTAEDRFCPKCFAIIEPPGLWQRLLAIFRRKSSSQAVDLKKVATVVTTKIVSHRGGDRHVYHSLEEVPPEQRAGIERLKAEALSAKGGHLFKVVDASGQERTYHSLEEMPPEIRMLLERAQRERDFT